MVFALTTRFSAQEHTDGLRYGMKNKNRRWASTTFNIDELKVMVAIFQGLNRGDDVRNLILRPEYGVFVSKIIRLKSRIERQLNG